MKDQAILSHTLDALCYKEQGLGGVVVLVEFVGHTAADESLIRSSSYCRVRFSGWKLVAFNSSVFTRLFLICFLWELQ